jgi:hypothetical protein
MIFLSPFGWSVGRGSTICPGFPFFWRSMDTSASRRCLYCNLDQKEVRTTQNPLNYFTTFPKFRLCNLSTHDQLQVERS